MVVGGRFTAGFTERTEQPNRPICSRGGSRRRNQQPIWQEVSVGLGNRSRCRRRRRLAASRRRRLQLPCATLWHLVAPSGDRYSTHAHPGPLQGAACLASETRGSRGGARGACKLGFSALQASRPSRSARDRQKRAREASGRTKARGASRPGRIAVRPRADRCTRGMPSGRPTSPFCKKLITASRMGACEKNITMKTERQETEGRGRSGARSSRHRSSPFARGLDGNNLCACLI